LTSRTIAKKIAVWSSEKKAEEIIILDMRKVANFCDYFVICSAHNERQVRAISDCIDDGLRTMGRTISHPKSAKDVNWIVMDSGDVVVHIFSKDAREFYNLEHLWQEAKMVQWETRRQES
jgi:ribosome-associated protein